MRKLAYGGGEHGSDTGIHCVASKVVKPDAGIGRKVGSRGYRTALSSEGVPCRPLRLLPQLRN
jgi:hypothetical protein